MKKILHYFLFLILFSLLSINVTAQELKYSDVNTIGKSTGYTSYVSKDGTVYKIGDVLRLAQARSTYYLFVNKLVLLSRMGAPCSEANTETEIRDIRIVKRGVFTNNGSITQIRTDEKDINKISKDDPFYVELRCKPLINTFTYCVAIDNAIASGEVAGLGLTSDEALTALKKAKDKLDLGLITQQEYDKTKSELSKIIK